MAKLLDVSIDSNAVLKAAGQLGQLDAATLDELLTDVVNQVTEDFSVSARRAMNANINLSDEYVSSRMVTTLANAGGANPTARIDVDGRLTILGNFAPVVTYVPAEVPGKARGDPKRGVPAGFKASGVTVEVSRGQRKAIKSPGAFTMTLKNGNGTGVFVRQNGVLTHLYGPAPYSLFNHQLTDAALDGIGLALEDGASAAIFTELGKVFE
jgi:hypothetical protein